MCAQLLSSFSLHHGPYILCHLHFLPTTQCNESNVAEKKHSPSLFVQDGQCHAVNSHVTPCQVPPPDGSSSGWPSSQHWLDTPELFGPPHHPTFLQTFLQSKYFAMCTTEIQTATQCTRFAPHKKTTWSTSRNLVAGQSLRLWCRRPIDRFLFSVYVYKKVQKYVYE